jgi:archaellum component FlaF (FlaF/FlaG flagellin family)
MGSWYGEPLNFYYLDYVIPSLAPAASASAQFKVTGVPASCHRFGVIRADLAVIDDILNMDAYSNFTMLEFNAEQTLQYVSAALNWDARPFSWPTTYYTGDIIHMNFGLMFQYEDEAGIDFFGMTPSSNMQLWDDEAILGTVVTIPDAARGDYDITIGEEITIRANVTNYGDCNATDVKLYFVHGLIGYNWQLEYIELFHEAAIGTVPAGESVIYDFDVNATTYLGLHAVVALVEYTTDPGEGALEVENPFTGNTLDWTWAGEELIMGHSSLMLALLRPAAPAEEPAFPQPVLDIDDTVESLGNHDYRKTVTITNIGDADTNLMANQLFIQGPAVVEVTDYYTTIGNDFYVNYPADGYQIVGVENIYLAPGESVTITIEFHAYSFALVPPIQVVYDSDYQNEFREEGLGSELFIYGHEMGDFKAQERDVTGTSSEENSWSDYSTTTSSVGAAATDDDVPGSDDGRTSFLGETYGYLLAASAMITAVVIIRRRK